MADMGTNWFAALIADTSAWSAASFICLMLLLFGLKGAQPFWLCWTKRPPIW
jgi:hypothetical protein